MGSIVAWAKICNCFSIVRMEESFRPRWVPPSEFGDTFGSLVPVDIIINSPVAAKLEIY